LYARHMAGQFQLQQLQPLHHCQHCFSNMVFWDVKRKRKWEREREMISGDRDVKRLFFNTQVVLLITKPIGTVHHSPFLFLFNLAFSTPRFAQILLHLFAFTFFQVALLTYCWKFRLCEIFNGLSSVSIQVLCCQVGSIGRCWLAWTKQIHLPRSWREELQSG
jgi:hypothetical protein